MLFDRLKLFPEEFDGLQEYMVAGYRIDRDQNVWHPGNWRTLTPNLPADGSVAKVEGEKKI